MNFFLLLCTFSTLVSIANFNTIEPDCNKPQTKTVSNNLDTNANLLLLIHEGEPYELGIPCGYVNSWGDTIVPIGKYPICWSDSSSCFVVVSNSRGHLALDLKGNEMYEVFNYDNGPDEISDGLFRIVIDGKIGYADERGKIVIPPQFECTTPFEDGKARVAYECTLEADGEHQVMNSNHWFEIDKTGNRIK